MTKHVSGTTRRGKQYSVTKPTLREMANKRHERTINYKTEKLRADKDIQIAAITQSGKTKRFVAGSAAASRVANTAVQTDVKYIDGGIGGDNDKDSETPKPIPNPNTDTSSDDWHKIV